MSLTRGARAGGGVTVRSLSLREFAAVLGGTMVFCYYLKELLWSGSWHPWFEIERLLSDLADRTRAPSQPRSQPAGQPASQVLAPRTVLCTTHCPHVRRHAEVGTEVVTVSRGMPTGTRGY